MLIKITDVCHMGCKHCMDDAKCEGTFMSLEAFKDIMEFCVKYDTGKALVISGGEPTEHPQFEDIMNILFEYAKKYPDKFLVTSIPTNGVEILNNPEKYKRIASEGVKIFCDRNKTLIKNNKSINAPAALFKSAFVFQISTDVRYYPKRVDITKRVFREPGFMVVDDCILKLNYIGRAKFNNLNCDICAPQCGNMRLITKQEVIKTDNLKLHEVIDLLLSVGKLCAPSINMDGTIKLGESHLCKPCASIYDSEEDIIDKIISFTCNGCDNEFHKLDILTSSIINLSKDELKAMKAMRGLLS